MVSLTIPLYVYLNSTKQNRDDPLAQEEAKYWAEYYRDFIAPDEEPAEPISDFYYPIIDELGRVKDARAGADDYDPSDRKIVGVLAVNIYWRDMIRNILPMGSNGIHFIADNSCTESFTFQINGPTVRYLGVGDHHDKEYDHLGIHSTLTDLNDFAIRDSTYSGAPLETEFCPFTLHVYPSDTMKAAYTSDLPIIFTVVTVLIFAFTSLVFCFYDYKVERRQQTVMQTAVRSTAIVSSLFPSAVRDRLYPAEEETSRDNWAGRSSQSFRNGKTGPGKDANTEGYTALSGSPIAELYPDTTVLFADIAGFTSWSSARTPTQVFHLLETLYAAFDAIAKNRGVFKVETIGDSYVAVVGLPLPRNHHAVVMVRFARDCRDKMCELTRELETTLGPVSIRSMLLICKAKTGSSILTRCVR